MDSQSIKVLKDSQGLRTFDVLLTVNNDSEFYNKCLLTFSTKHVCNIPYLQILILPFHTPKDKYSHAYSNFERSKMEILYPCFSVSG